MRAPPENFEVEELARLLEWAWAFPVADLRYAPVGFGSHHWVAVDTDGGRLFVTVDELDQPDADARMAAFERLERALLTAHRLREAGGLSFVIGPVPDADGAVVVRHGERYAVAVFPFVEGRDYPEGVEPTRSERAEVVGMLARLHAAGPVNEYAPGIEDFAIPGRLTLERALDRLHVQWGDAPFAEPTRDLLISASADVRARLGEYDSLATAARNGKTPWVTTHGEPKSDNLLVTGSGLVLVDWDTAMRAPAARDLWMVDAGEGEECALYSELTGRSVSDDEMTLYRLRWDLADICDFVGWFTTPHSRSADSEVAWTALCQSLCRMAPT